MAARKTKTTTAASEEQLDAKKALDTAVKQINKDFGDGSIMMLGQNTKKQISAVPTGSQTIDMALGVGGLPRGRITEIYGPEASGKTTLALHCVAETQKLGGYAAYIDAEHALDPLYARNLGVNIDELLVSQPDSGEQALEIAEALVRSNAIDCLVIDSVAALVPQRGNRRRNGRQSRRRAGASDEPGDAQALFGRLPHQLRDDFHQPAPREDRRYVRQPGSYHRRPRP